METVGWGEGGGGRKIVILIEFLFGITMFLILAFISFFTLYFLFNDHFSHYVMSLALCHQSKLSDALESLL